MKGKNTLLLLSLLLGFNIFCLHLTVGFCLIIYLGEFWEMNSKIVKSVQIHTARQIKIDFYVGFDNFCGSLF